MESPWIPGRFRQERLQDLGGPDNVSVAAVALASVAAELLRHGGPPDRSARADYQSSSSTYDGELPNANQPPTDCADMCGWPNCASPTASGFAPSDERNTGALW